METEQMFVDTNLFLRYLTNDVPEQADAVEELLHKAAAGNLTLVTNSVVMAEIVWTLESFYQLERKDIREKIVAILNTAGLIVIEGDLVLQAITGYVEKMWTLLTHITRHGCCLVASQRHIHLIGSILSGLMALACTYRKKRRATIITE
jgi:predicted nucleic-acid-binding protein